MGPKGWEFKSFIMPQRARCKKEGVASYLFWSTVVSELAVLLQDVVFLRICNFLSSVIFLGCLKET